ncbi:MAG TPA: ABC transporter ATP-binding protein [Pseudonocardiaceae bacterium]|jgi:ABC-2 type transport system ATP-binding protein|nr:ABC transporter ATP-binding protein [Pseudonocardiaceae bacterium]
MIEVRELIKDYGDKRAVNQLSFIARPGMVTGFVGPKGSGKSTTMRIVLGLDTPTSGTALVNGQHHAALKRSMRTVGAMLEVQAVPADCTAADHLRFLGRESRICPHRVTEVLRQVELSAMADKRVSELPHGMRQRLGVAGALLNDPGVLLFDEPMRGLDAENIEWSRDLMQSLADEGRTVLVSSSQMQDMALTADHLLIINHGELIMEAATAELIDRFHRDVLVRSPRRSGLTRVLTDLGATVRAESGGGLSVTGIDSWRIASAAAEHHIPLQELTPRNRSLEDFYQELTGMKPR